jgi:type II secretory pathway component GspD/PulD (secretin)
MKSDVKSFFLKTVLIFILIFAYKPLVLKSEDTNANSTIKPNKFQKTYKLDLPNIKLKDFASFYAALKSKVLVGGDKLEGNITVSFKEQVTSKKIDEIFGAFLNDKGFAFIERNSCIIIVPKKNEDAKVYPLEYIESLEISTAMSSVLRGSSRIVRRGAAPEVTEIGHSIESNSIIFLADNIKQTQMKNAIHELDSRRKQILLEVKFVEISLDTEAGFGINFADFWKKSQGKLLIGTDAIDIAQASVALPKVSPSYISFIKKYASPKFSVNTGANYGKVKVLAQPSVLTYDNKEACINIETRQPIAKSISITAADAGKGATQVQPEISFENIGIMCKIFPIITPENKVLLNTEITFSSIAKTTTIYTSVPVKHGTDSEQVDYVSYNYPVISSRSIKNTCIVENHSPLIIGGILDERKLTKKNFVPIFGSLPYIGELLARTEETSELIEIMIIITPRIITNLADLQKTTAKQIAKIENYDPNQKETISTMLKAKKTKKDNVFNMYEYFESSKYRKKEQDFVFDVEK